MLTALTMLLACSGPEPAFDPGPEPAFVPPEPALRRLTTRQYENTVRDLFGDWIVPPTSLEPDTTLEFLPSLGAAVSSTSPLGVERYEAGARLLADQVFAGEVDPLPCVPASPSDAACAGQFVDAWGPRIYRRSLEPEERSMLVELTVAVGAEAVDFRTGARFALVAMLQSPWFLYRVEHAPGTLAPTEIATRLSYFLWNGPPDEGLLAAAEDGRLATAEGRAAEVDRMMADPRFRRGVRDFFSELLHLEELDGMTKDPLIFPHTSPELWDSAREETLMVLEDLIIDRDADYREILLGHRTWIDTRLAALYEVPAPNLDGFGWHTFPEDSPRMGLLGHASVLGLHAHPVSSSATRRGKFIRSTLLCQAVPPPPADVDTSIPEPTNAPTLRDRLQVHQEDPTCATCHIFLDNAGLALENFDGIGRWRTRENNARIDPSGDLDGMEFDDARGLARTLTEHEDFAHCVAERLTAYAVGHPITNGEEDFVEWATADFMGNDYRVRHLMRRIALSDAFAKGGE